MTRHDQARVRLMVALACLALVSTFLLMGHRT